VLDAISRTLHLSSGEHNYVRALAGYSGSQPEDDPDPPALPAHMTRLLDTAELPAAEVAYEFQSINPLNSGGVGGYYLIDEKRNLPVYCELQGRTRIGRVRLVRMNRSGAAVRPSTTSPAPARPTDIRWN